MLICREILADPLSPEVKKHRPTEVRATAGVFELIKSDLVSSLKYRFVKISSPSGK